MNIVGVSGFSGSTVVDKETGKAVGIFTGKITKENTDENLYYAIPIHYLWKLIKRIENKKNDLPC